MPETTLKQQLVERFQEVNGDHPMTDADDEYVSAQFVALEELCAVHGREADAVRRLTELFEWARFSQHEPEPAMRDEAVDALSAVRDELRASELAPA